MSKDLSISLLMDFYGQLLTSKQLEVLEFYYNDDLSLAEIADGMSISRQGVRDFIKRGEKQLSDFEQKLGLAGRFEKIKDKIEQIDMVADRLAAGEEQTLELQKLKALTRQVVNEL
ncbi:MAG: putative DNA-binding protein [Clostridia bacterium]|nr:putative DNA-binding protein [Clostridia bacterium]